MAMSLSLRVRNLALHSFRSSLFPVATLLGVASVAALGCGDVSKPPGPRLISGGGVGDGKIDGTLNVYVTDEDTRAPIQGASVRVGASADPAPCEALTDSTGLALFSGSNCPSLKGPVTLTASASGYAPSTWVGVNGVNLTMQVRGTPRPTPDTAMVTGTIAGWDTMPAPATNHQTLALVATSQSPDLGDYANDIPQGTRTIDVLGGLTTTDIPANVCVRSALADDCNWQLRTRTGPQAHFALIVDQDTKGTTDQSDDTNTVIGWAIKTGLTFAADASATDETLTVIADADLQSFTASFPSLPAGMAYLASYPMLNLGTDGRIPIISPVLDLTHTTSRVPKPTGALAGATYDLLAQAQKSKTEGAPATLSLSHHVNAAATVAVPTWLPAPTALSTAGGTFSFAAVAGASLHSAELQDSTGARAWAITIFDGSTSFTLPGLSPDPLPLGTVKYQVSALAIPGIDLGNVSFEDAKDKVNAISSDGITFAH
jgi:hypothetical protein